MRRQNYDGSTVCPQQKGKKMTRVIMIRHGQSVANAEGRFAGHSDYDLTELGRTQALLTAAYVCEHEKVDVIYSSDLLRAYNTALPVAEQAGLTVIPCPALREIYAGKWEGMLISDIDKKYPEDFRAWKYDFSNARCTGGESIDEVYSRTVAIARELAERHDGCTLLLSAHATVVRALSAHACGLPAERINEIEFSHNASVNIFTFADGRFAPERLNIHEHLGELTTGVIKALNA